MGEEVLVGEAGHVQVVSFLNCLHVLPFSNMVSSPFFFFFFFLLRSRTFHCLKGFMLLHSGNLMLGLIITMFFKILNL